MAKSAEMIFSTALVKQPTVLYTSPFFEKVWACHIVNSADHHDDKFYRKDALGQRLTPNRNDWITTYFLRLSLFMLNAVRRLPCDSAITKVELSFVTSIPLEA